MNIYHNDLKPDNILCNVNNANIKEILIDDIKIKLIDFGVSCHDNENNKTFIKCTLTKKGTEQYIHPLSILLNDPEVKNLITQIQNSPEYNRKTNFNFEFIDFDNWSFGIIILEFYSVELFFMDSSLTNEIDKPDRNMKQEIAVKIWVLSIILNLYITQIILQNITTMFEQFEQFEKNKQTTKWFDEYFINDTNIVVILKLRPGLEYNPQNKPFLNKYISTQFEKIWYKLNKIPNINTDLTMEIEKLFLFPPLSTSIPV